MCEQPQSIGWVDVSLLLRGLHLRRDGVVWAPSGRPTTLTWMMRMCLMLRMYLLALASRVIDLARTANRSRCFASLLREAADGAYRNALTWLPYSIWAYDVSC